MPWSNKWFSKTSILSLNMLNVSQQILHSSLSFDVFNTKCFNIHKSSYSNLNSRCISSIVVGCLDVRCCLKILYSLNICTFFWKNKVEQILHLENLEHFPISVKYCHIKSFRSSMFLSWNIWWAWEISVFSVHYYTCIVIWQVSLSFETHGRQQRSTSFFCKLFARSTFFLSFFFLACRYSTVNGQCTMLSYRQVDSNWSGVQS